MANCCMPFLMEDLEENPILMKWASNVVVKLEEAMIRELNAHTSNVSVLVEQAFAKALAPAGQ